MKYIIFLIVKVLIVLFLLTCWVINANKFFQCDFEGPWKEEIVHGIGLVFPPTSIFTVWL